MLKFDKKQIKLISIVVVAMFVIGIVAIAATQLVGTGKGYAASSSRNSSIGVVNYSAFFRDLPEIKKVTDQMKAEVEAAQKDFATKSKAMNDQQKQQLGTQIQQQLMTKDQELIKPVTDKVEVAIKAVADAKGITVVMEKSNIIFGGQDITDEVFKKLTGK